LGGALAPGIEISVDALAARAAQLRKVELVKPKSVIGKNTVEALQSGTIYGFAGQVDGLVTRIIEELEQLYPGTGSTTVVATGGLAPLVVGISETIDSHEPDLTLLGLGMIFDRNTVSDLDEAEPTEPTQVVEPAESAEVVEPDNPMVDQAPTADI
jgi:type III pantothenate kinase